MSAPGCVGAGAVVEADRLVGREEVVGPAVRDQHRRRFDRVVDVVRGVVGRDLLGDVVGQRDRVVGPARIEQRVPGVEIRVGIGPRRRVVRGRGAGGEETGDEALLQDADGGIAIRPGVGRVGDVIERAPVRHQRVGEVGPGDLRRRRGDLHRVALRARPGNERAVPCRNHLAVAQRSERHRDTAAVGTTERADLLPVDHALVIEDRPKNSCASRTSYRVSIRRL